MVLKVTPKSDLHVALPLLPNQPRASPAVNYRLGLRCRSDACPSALNVLGLHYVISGIAQMYVRLAELPLYLSRSPTEGGFKRMKDGYFRQQAVSAPVEEVRRKN